MKKTFIFSTLLAVVLAASLLFVSCPTSGGGGGGGGGGSTGGGLGDTLTLSGPVYTMQENTDGSYDYTRYLGPNIIDFLSDAGGTGSITSGQLSFKIGVPDGLHTMSAADIDVFGIYSGVNILPSNTKGKTLSFSTPSLSKEIYDVRGTSISIKVVNYIYVDSECTITAAGGSVTTDTNYLITAPRLDIKLYKGWNAVNTQIAANSTPTPAGTLVIKTGDSSDCKWVIDLSGGGGGTGMTWNTAPNIQSLFGGDHVMGMAYGNGKFVAVFQHHIGYSSDGRTWQAVTNSTSIFGTDMFYKVAYGNGKFVAVGESNKIAYSSDGITWETKDVKSAFGGVLSNILEIAYGNGKFVAGDNYGKTATSTDGVNWTAAGSTSINPSIWGIAYGNGMFVAGGYGGKMAYSTDCTTWTAVSNTTFGTDAIEEIAYGNGRFVAVGLNGKVATSTDGSTWTAGTIGILDYIYAIGYGNGTFVAGDLSGNMAYSTNGTTWTVVANSVSFDIYAIAYGNGIWVAGGSGDGGNGAIAYSTGN